MFRQSIALLRRGKPRPRAGMFPDKYRRVPTLLKPQQGGQQFFSDFLIRTANDEVINGDAWANEANSNSSQIHPLLPQMDLGTVMDNTTEERIANEMQAIIANDAFSSVRGFNEREWYEDEKANLSKSKQHGGSSASTGGTATGLPERVLGEDYFQSRYGYSLVKDEKDHSPAGIVDYSQLELWGEMPKYQRDTIFLYLVSRRRNTYAVAYDYEGKRLMPTYTSGNRGLKGGDRGFRGDGSTDVGHQVTSLYLNDLLPKIREMRASAGRPMEKGEKIDVVVRVLGFYNGRQGAVRAVQDRSNDFVVRYLEDVTPFPMNGPKMPHGVFR